MLTEENQAASIHAEMAASMTLLQCLLMLVAGWLHRQEAAVIEYLKAENRVLRERLGGRRIIFTDAERRHLAEKARTVGRKALRELGTMVTPETLLRWHRELVARKWSFVERRRPGRPRTRKELVALVVRMASENPSWGYTRIQGAMLNLGHKLGRGTICRILKDHGIEPAPERGKGMPWAVFLKAHWKGLAASDFFTVEVWSWRGLMTHYVLFVIELQQVAFADAAPGAARKQQALAPESPHHRTGRARLPEGLEHQPHRLLDLLIGIQHDRSVGAVDEPDRKRHFQLAPSRLVTDATLQTRFENMQLRLAHRALQAQEQPVVEVCRIVDAVLVTNEGCR